MVVVRVETIDLKIKLMRVKYNEIIRIGSETTVEKVTVSESTQVEMFIFIGIYPS